MQRTYTCSLMENTVPATLGVGEVLATLQRATLEWSIQVPEVRFVWASRAPQEWEVKPWDVVFKFGNLLDHGRHALGHCEMKTVAGNQDRAGFRWNRVTFSNIHEWKAAASQSVGSFLARFFAGSKQDLLTVALHQLGHVLQVPHSAEFNSVMHPCAEHGGTFNAPAKADGEKASEILKAAGVSALAVLLAAGGGFDFAPCLSTACLCKPLQGVNAQSSGQNGGFGQAGPEFLGERGDRGHGQR